MKMNQWLRVCLTSCLIVASWVSHGVFANTPTSALKYPEKPVRIIVPFPPGGTTDIVARLVAERLQTKFGQAFVIENKAGASGNIGIAEAIRSPADGYTLVLGSVQTIAINPMLSPGLRLEPQKNLAPIVVIASVSNVLLVSNKVPAQNVQELVELVRKNNGNMTYASTSLGGTPHLSGEWFKSMTGASIVHVPYKGSAPALQELMGGQVDMMFDNLPSSLSHIRAGSVRALAVTSLKRAPSAPDLPTLDESGLKGFDSEGWFSLLAPANTPRPILDQINAAVNEALDLPDFRERLQKAGADPVGGSIESFRQRIENETQRWGRVIQSANIKVE